MFTVVRDGTQWIQPTGPHGPIPRKTAWMVAAGCQCSYRYGGLEVAPCEYPPWMTELMRLVMPMCGFSDDQAMPNSCNLNLYDDGNNSVGWHADDEALFQGKFRDCCIISLSFGARRRFEVRLNWPKEGERCLWQLQLGDGDLCTMEGMTQKHFQHRIAREAMVAGPRINLTWRWISKHAPHCPSARAR
uniref:Fe2OG dioxygenase domain-containing protein n=1 Tax=Zooxanthella nutricula TaxID=1333877 RepID=A0A7S2QA99_9DINO